MQPTSATHDEVVNLLGDADDLAIARILETGATVTEIAEAIDIVAAEQQLDEQRVPSSTSVANVRAVLLDMIPDGDDDDGAPADERERPPM